MRLHNGKYTTHYQEQSGSGLQSQSSRPSQCLSKHLVEILSNVPCVVGMLKFQTSWRLATRSTGRKFSIILHFEHTLMYHTKEGKHYKMFFDAYWNTQV